MENNILTPHPTTHLTPALQYKLIYVYTRPDAEEAKTATLLPAGDPIPLKEYKPVPFYALVQEAKL